MTKRDFELIARTIRDAYPEMPPTARAMVRETYARDFANALAVANPRFDKVRFVAACCGVED